MFLRSTPCRAGSDRHDSSASRLCRDHRRAYRSADGGGGRIADLGDSIVAYIAIAHGHCHPFACRGNARADGDSHAHSHRPPADGHTDQHVNSYPDSNGHGFADPYRDSSPANGHAFTYSTGSALANTGRGAGDRSLLVGPPLRARGLSDSCCHLSLWLYRQRQTARSPRRGYPQSPGHGGFGCGSCVRALRWE